MTDHKAEAERLAGMAGDTYGMIETRNEGMSVAMMIEAQTLAVTAQVHATLHLAEQQRIANIIELARFTGFDPESMARRLEVTAELALVDGDDDLLPEIKEALGLS